LARYITQIYMEIENVPVCICNETRRGHGGDWEALPDHVSVAGSSSERRAQLKAEARSWLQKSLSVWQD
jgi:hypothetical protein